MFDLWKTALVKQVLCKASFNLYFHFINFDQVTISSFVCYRALQKIELCRCLLFFLNFKHITKVACRVQATHLKE